MLEVDNALRFVSEMTATTSTSKSLRQKILVSLSGNKLSVLLRRFADQELPRSEFHRGHESCEVCPATFVKAKIRLHQILAVLFLRSTLFESQYEDDIDTSGLAKMLEKKLGTSVVATAPCTYMPPMRAQASGKVSFFEAESTPRVQSISHDWRNDLIQELSRDASYRYESIVRRVGEICRDLELRCNEHELPLRHEQSKSEDLQTRLEAARTKVADLESEAQDQISRVVSLENEKNSLSLQLDTAEKTVVSLKNERDSLSEQLRMTQQKLQDLAIGFNNMRQECDQTIAEAEGAARDTMEISRQQDLAYLATMNGKDQMFEEQAQKLTASTNQVKAFEAELNQIRQQEINLNITIHEKEVMVQDLSKSMESSKELQASIQAQNDRLLSAEKELIAVNKGLTEKVMPLPCCSLSICYPWVSYADAKEL